MPDPTHLETLLQERTRFRRLQHVASCPSTQELAAADPAPGDGIYWADHQTRGRGRQQREWHDEPGVDLALTLRVRCRLPQPLALPAALPVAVLLACEDVAGRPLTVKWPNDVYCAGRKLSGVLIDAGVGNADTFLIGIGVNVNRVRFPPDLETRATSLALATGHEVDREDLLLRIATRVDAMLQDLAVRRHDRLEALFRDRLGLLGQRVRVEATAVHEGVLTGLDFERLVLDGTRTVPLAVVRSLQRG